MWQSHLNISVQAGCISIQTEKVALSTAWPPGMEHPGSVWLRRERLKISYFCFQKGEQESDPHSQ